MDRLEEKRKVKAAAFHERKVRIHRPYYLYLHTNISTARSDQAPSKGSLRPSLVVREAHRARALDPDSHPRLTLLPFLSSATRLPVLQPGRGALLCATCTSFFPTLLVCVYVPMFNLSCWYWLIVCGEMRNWVNLRLREMQKSPSAR